MPKNTLARPRSSSRNNPPIVNIADEEDVGDYGPGGYLNVKVGDEFVSPNRRAPYVAVRKLGCVLPSCPTSPSSSTVDGDTSPPYGLS